MNKGSILDMPEDLLGEAQPKQRSKSPKSQSRHVTNQRNQLESGSSLDALVSETAYALGIDMEELRNWTQEAIVPKDVLKSLLTIAKRYQLNPLTGQIDWEANLDGSYEVYIPIDGWISLMHRQPTFQGIHFDQSPETEYGIPIWMECTIYRSDLTHPITVREYYAELKTDHPIWSQMPRRMLRHKTLQQCARLAFGINMSEPNEKKCQVIKSKLNSSIYKKDFQNSKSLLRQKLEACNIYK
jgi:hypothetical protein